MTDHNRRRSLVDGSGTPYRALMTTEADRAGSFTAASLPVNYERHLAPYLFQPWAEVLLDAVALAPGAAVLDVAAGTGVVSRAAARRTGADGRVAATDISPAMIEFLAGHPPESGAAPIDTAVAPATELGFAHDEFDVVLCQQGMPFISDRVGAVREMHRVLRPDGVVGLAVFSPGHGVPPFGLLNGALRDVGAEAPFAGGYDESSYVLSAAETAELLSGAGFTDIHSREVELITSWPGVQSLVAGLSGTPFAAVFAALDAERQDQARALIAERFAEFVRGDVVEVPTYSVIARATA
jgi:ubiquinone/menaquinone biosynthesis C-methylase UbiE